MSAATLPIRPGGPPVLVTGAAGFIGYHMTIKLNQLGVSVIGFDNVNDYYEQKLKEDRLDKLFGTENRLHDVTTTPISSTSTSSFAATKSQGPNQLFTFIRAELEQLDVLQALFEEHTFELVIHLAAQAGVRYSLTNPLSYIRSNLVGFEHILECCRHHHVKHLTYASSSSVYGGNMKTPFSEQDNVDHPVSLYAATKKSNELMAHAYAHLFNMPCTGLRFFTVYGPYGRPDMATAIFAGNILRDKPIDVFNDGKMQRDFTYVDDIVEGIYRIAERPPQPNPLWDATNPDPSVSSAPYRVLNIGNSDPVELGVFISTLERVLGKEAVKNMKPMQPGDVLVTSADTSMLESITGFAPSTPLERGLESYVAWYRSYYGL
ncbi:NAD-dependent epimerase/dehydratase, putative [Bodo saltans]|uniref:NAD-dependent epimerase/dehydratase, putative n=1 Tax=Bodo saltans TaxID=75058 RepID=A0A0S4KEP1_BODSA|nr:NAD-dependent epimerase/dehydratase, putative [Bodo saltans]|eukprot:CUI14155.1 NAD-dependent epimerase/dehydratase, putative [Bodo saltans]